MKHDSYALDALEREEYTYIYIYIRTRNRFCLCVCIYLYVYTQMRELDALEREVGWGDWAGARGWDAGWW